MEEYSPSLAALGRSLTLEYFGNDLEVGAYFIIRPHGDINKPGLPVYIVDGKFWGEYGLSNSWRCKVVNPDGTLRDKIIQTYGSCFPYFVKVTKEEAMNMAILIHENVFCLKDLFDKDFLLEYELSLK